jgi:hypothetical protein
VNLTTTDTRGYSDQKLLYKIERGRLVPQSFKMVLPSMIQDSASNSVQGKESSNMIDDWPVLSTYQCSKIKPLPSTTKQAPLVMNSPERQGFQNSN